MNNNNFDDIKVPNNIDSFIKAGIDKASREKRYMRSKNIRQSIVASISGIIIIGMISPALAAKLPIVGNIFEMIEKNLIFPSNYSEYSTAVNQVAKSNGVSVTLKEVACDGYKLYVTYLVENERPFKWTYTDDKYKHLDVTQLDTVEAYNKVSFTNKELPTWGITGLNGKYIDEKTFIGMHTYDLEGLETSIPDEFDFQVKITSFMTSRMGPQMPFSLSTKSYNGTWAFKVPVTVDKSLSKKIEYENAKAEGVALDSVVITPFEIIASVNFGNMETINKQGLDMYGVKLYDENNREISFTGGQTYKNLDKYFFNAVSKNNKNIRVVIYKNNYKLANEKSDKSKFFAVGIGDGSTNIEYEKFEQKLIDKVIKLD